MAEPTTGVRFGGTARDDSGNLITSNITANTYAIDTTTPAVGTEDSTFTNGQFDITDSGFGRFDLKILNGTDQIWWSSRAEVQVTTLHARNPTTASAALEVFSTTSEASSLVAVFGFRPSTESSGVETADTPSDNDTGYINFELSNDNATPQQWIAGRLAWIGTDVSDGTEDADLEFLTMVGGSLASALKIGTSGASGSVILDEDNMASDSATHLATQQSIKAYVDAAKIHATVCFGAQMDLAGNFMRANGEPNQTDTTDESLINIAAPITGTINSITVFSEGDLSSNNATFKVWVNGSSVKSLTASSGADAADLFTAQAISVTAGQLIKIEWDAGSSNPEKANCILVIEGS